MLMLHQRSYFRLCSKSLRRVVLSWSFNHLCRYTSAAVKKMDVPLVQNAVELPDCPYLVDSRLSLEIYPLTATGTPLPPFNASARVLQPFLPFTNSQAIKAQVTSSSQGDEPTLPSVVVLKLFDRRFVERIFPEPWSSSGEATLRKKVLDFSSEGRHVMKATIPELFGLFCERKNVNSWVDSDFFDEEAQSFLDPEPWEDEVVMYGQMISRLAQEAKIYTHLSSLQGTRIPRLYGVVQCVLTRGTGRDDLITRVPGLILEYVGGKTLRDLHVGENISTEKAEDVSQEVLQTICELRKHRVLHGDIRRANIVVRDADYMPLLIDFVDSGEYTHVTEEQFLDIAQGIRESFEARLFLEEQGLHSPSPYVLRPTVFRRGFRDHNRVIEGKSEKWREKYVERIEVNGPLFEVRVDENGAEYEWEHSRWKFKPGVKTCYIEDA